MCLFSPYCRPDFDDDDDDGGSKLFRYIGPSLFFWWSKMMGIVECFAWAAVITSRVFSVFPQVWWWNRWLQQWQRALCQVGGWIGRNKCVWRGCSGVIIMILKLLPCCFPSPFQVFLSVFVVFVFPFYTSFYFGRDFWASVLVGWFHFQVFGRRSEFCR